MIVADEWAHGHDMAVLVRRCLGSSLYSVKLILTLQRDSNRCDGDGFEWTVLTEPDGGIALLRTEVLVRRMYEQGVAPPEGTYLVHFIAITAIAGNRRVY
jgi:hypothetical protein